jgi:RNA polymerase sigma-70 factor (ECF subfamily)
MSAAVDPAEFEALVGPWLDEMYRAAAAIVGRAEAADVTQDALLDAWRGLQRLRDPARIRPWLHAIVANRSRKQIRSWHSRPRLVDLSVTPEPAADDGDPGDLAARRDQLDRAFDRLSADQRICVALRYSIDLPVSEVAEALGIPEGTVKSRLHAAVHRLRASLVEEDR